MIIDDNIPPLLVTQLRLDVQAADDAIIRMEQAVHPNHFNRVEELRTVRILLAGVLHRLEKDIVASADPKAE
jgi:hypothetical protein